MNYINLYEDGNYKLSYRETLRSFKSISEDSIVYLIKNIITKDGFQITDKKQMKLLVFYYFYLRWEVNFDNDYDFFICKESLNINLVNLKNIDNIWLVNFKQYFKFWRNEIFLNNIVDLSSGEGIESSNESLQKADNIIDFFLYFLHQNFELYSLKWKHFTLFKWIINEIV